VVRLVDGQQLHGCLERFNAFSSVLKLRLRLNGSELFLPLKQVKQVTLSAPTGLVEDPMQKTAVADARSISNFGIQFIDGDSWEGETKGSITTEAGVFLYTMLGDHPKYVGAARQNIARHFVPLTATRDVRIGATCDAVRIDSGNATPAVIDFFPSSVEPRVLEPATPGALELLCKGQNTHLEPLKLGDALKQLGIVTDEDVKAAMALQATRKDGKRLGEILMEMKQLSEETIRQALFHRLGIPFVRLNRLKSNTTTVARIDRRESLGRACAVLHETAGSIYVAMANPMDEETIRTLRFHLQKKIEIVMADRADIAAFLMRHAAPASNGLAPDLFFS